MNEEFLEQHEIGCEEEYNDEILSENLEGGELPSWVMWVLLIIMVVGFAFIFGMMMGNTRTVTQGEKIVYVSDSGLSDKIDDLTEKLELSQRPHDNNYRLCDWRDFDCEEGVDYIEKEWWEKDD